MSRNTVPLSQIVGDYMLTQEENDFSSNSSHAAIHNVALRGIREIGFDIGKKIKSLKLAIDSSNNTVELPDDFVDLSKIGSVGADGLVHVFPENKHINYSRAYANSAGTAVSSSSSANDSDDDGVYDRVDSKGATVGDEGGTSLNDVFESYIFRNFVHGVTQGRLYGVGGGQKAGMYRLNLEQNRIELDTDSGINEIVIEYIADEARSSDPNVHVYAEEALRAYIYYKLVERKTNVPMAEKARARSEFYNERRKANSRLSNFTKQEALQVIQKNFKQSPKV
jgi:hypothetical protein